VAASLNRRGGPSLRIRARALRERAVLERDLASFRRRYGSVLRPKPEPSRGIALLASLSFSTFQVKLEGMIAKALQRQGLDVVAAVPREGTLVRRYFELFGVERFVMLEDYAPSDGEVDVAELLADVRSAEDLKRLRFRGADVGRQVLSTLSRYRHEGSVDLTDPDARALAEELLPAAMRTTLAAEALLDDVGPELVVFNERNYADQGPVSDVALERGLNVIQFVSGFDDDTLVFKRYTAATKGIHPRSLSDESWEIVRRVDWTAERQAELDAEFARRYDKHATFLARWNQGWTREHSRDELQRELGLDPSRPTAVVFSHVLWDANMFYGRDLFRDQEEWFVETVRAAAANDRANWIVKLHPSNVWKLRRDGYEGELDEVRAIRGRIGELPAHVRLLLPDTEIGTWSLFSVIDVGVTIRGSTGFELPCFGVPALTAGTGFYSGRGFTIDSESREEYLGRLAQIEETPRPTQEQVELARRHAWGLFRARQTRFTSFRSVYQPVEHVDRPFEATIEVSARTAAELAAADDLRLLGEWAVESRALDYLDRQVVRVEAREL
jgi:hypothetical protein